MREYAMNTAGMSEDEIAAAHARFAKEDAPKKSETVIDLLRDIDAARARMGVSNPHKSLLYRCGAAVIELAQRANAMETQHIGALEVVPE